MQKQPPIISVKDVNKRIGDSETIFIDLRDKEDYVKEHISGAINIPAELFEEEKYVLAKGYRYIFYCDHGGTSMQVVVRLREDGLEAESLVGGMEEYKRFLVDIRQSKL